MDSTRAIIALWRLCVPAGVGPQAAPRSQHSACEVGGDGAIPVDVLKVQIRKHYYTII